MGSWMISKKRYWGLALPIWVDEQDPTQYEVIGSYEELKERAVEGWAEFEGHTPHRPFIDRVKIKNPRTGNLMARVPDVGNPWLDAGIVAFSTLPREWYPAGLHHRELPGAVPQLVLRAVGDVHDDERRAAAVQDAARARAGEGPVRQPDEQE
jgi:isoleucyl-tRNA synthetase